MTDTALSLVLCRQSWLDILTYGNCPSNCFRGLGIDQDESILAISFGSQFLGIITRLLQLEN